MGDESAAEESATIYPHLFKNVSFFMNFNCLSVLLVKCRQNGGATSIFDGFIMVKSSRALTVIIVKSRRALTARDVCHGGF